MSPRIQTVAVIGCGVIGASWACLFLSRGLKVIISDPAEGAEERFKLYLNESWSSLRAAGSTENEPADNYEFVDDILPRLEEVDFIQENGPENTQFKQSLMESLDQHARVDVVIASSSSGLPSSEFIQHCRRDPGRVLIGHPFNPPHLVPLVEVVPHPETKATSIATAIEFYKSLGKRPILLRHEVPGFVANRLQAAINNEAYSLISRGIVSPEDLDVAVTCGPGIRWAQIGPIVSNALGGGGGSEGFLNRFDRLGPSIRRWEGDMLKHRFDWNDESLSVLKTEVLKWLEEIDWARVKEERDRVMLQLLAIKSQSPSATQSI